MKIHLMSDLHLEFGRMRAYEPPECDVVVLAGDIDVGKPGVMWAMDTFKVPVIYVCGNHEFYGGRIYRKHIADLRDKARGSNVMVLDNEAVNIDGVRFLGGTLWTDYNLYGDAPLRMAMADVNDYRQICTADRKYLVPADTVAFHEETRRFLEDELSKDGPFVVVTHHGPSELSIDPRYVGDSFNPAYVSRMDDLIERTQPALWLHGHVHSTMDYSIGATMVRTNPRGYHGYELNPDFDPHLVLEVL